MFTYFCFFFSSRRRHTICALVTGVRRVLFRSNRSVFYAADGSMRSLAEIRERFRVKLEAGGKIENMKPLAPARWHAQASSSSGLAGAAGGGRPPLQLMDIPPMRSEERRVGKEGVRTCRSRGSTYN